jgi:hypothetical protein
LLMTGPLQYSSSSSSNPLSSKSSRRNLSSVLGSIPIILFRLVMIYSWLFLSRYCIRPSRYDPIVFLEILMPGSFFFLFFNFAWDFLDYLTNYSRNSFMSTSTIELLIA